MMNGTGNLHQPQHRQHQGHSQIRVGQRAAATKPNSTSAKQQLAAASCADEPPKQQRRRIQPAAAADGPGSGARRRHVVRWSCTSAAAAATARPAATGKRQSARQGSLASSEVGPRERGPARRHRGRRVQAVRACDELGGKDARPPERPDLEAEHFSVRRSSSRHPVGKPCPKIALVLVVQTVALRMAARGPRQPPKRWVCISTSQRHVTWRRGSIAA